MFAMTYNRRQSLSILLVLSMFFCMWMTVSPLNSANAGILKSVGNIAKSIFVNVGALAAGAMTAVLGAAVGGGPLGMAIGGVAGYFVGKKVLKWTTSSVANFATVAGAVAGGFLCAGMGFPMLAIGVVGGGLIARLLVKGVGAIINKITGGSTALIKKGDIDPDAAQQENAEVVSFIQSLQEDNTTTTTAVKEEVKPAKETSSSYEVKDSQTAYNNYIAAYQDYVNCTQKGDVQGAKKAQDVYVKNMELYQSLLKQGL